MHTPILEKTNQLVQTQATFLPFFEEKVAAGFPSALEDPIENKLDLNDYLIKHPAATFLVKANGLSMTNVGIHDNDLLVVDRSLTPVNGKVVVAAVDGQLTVKIFQKTPEGKLWLLPAHDDFSPIEIKEGSEIFIWGVVTNVIHPL